MTNELYELALRREDLIRQRKFAQSGNDESRVAKLTREINAISRDLGTATEDDLAQASVQAPSSTSQEWNNRVCWETRNIERSRPIL